MLKLMKLEVKKYRITSQIKGFVIANLAILAFMMIIMIGGKADGDIELKEYATVFTVIQTFSSITFTIFAAALIGRFIIGEYNKKTIMVLFMYPISRKKLLTAKLSVIVIFTFLSIFLTNLIIGSFLFIINSFYPFITEQLTNVKVINFLMRSVFSALAFSGVSLIPLYFGMRKKSVSATIISSILIASLLCSNANGFSLSSIAAVPISFAVIGVIVAYFTIRNIEQNDIE